MALKHWSGPGIAGEVVQKVAPPPSRPAPAPDPEPTPHAIASAYLEAKLAIASTANVTITVIDRTTDIEITAEGDTLPEAVESAVAQYEAAQPIQPLIWASGAQVDGLALALLLRGLDFVEDSALGQGEPPAVLLMIGRLRGALGQGDGEREGAQDG